MIFDLHTHTTYSDGVLNPEQLVSRAIEKGVDVLAMTDHDTVDACHAGLSTDRRITLIHGVEFSTQWCSTGVHVVGLNIDSASDAMMEGVRFQTRARLERAHQIAQNLEKKGIENAFEGAAQLSTGEYVGRPHFAQYLLESGRVDSIQEAFKKYLGDGKAGDVKQHWADLAQVVQWIRDAKGVAVLAHPLKYRFTATRLKRMLDIFIEAGGTAMEVISGRQLPHQTAHLATLCRDKGLYASCGSDFHAPGMQWAELGSFGTLPSSVTPVWETF